MAPFSPVLAPVSLFLAVVSSALALQLTPPSSSPLASSAPLPGAPTLGFVSSPVSSPSLVLPASRPPFSHASSPATSAAAASTGQAINAVASFHRGERRCGRDSAQAFCAFGAGRKQQTVLGAKLLGSVQEIAMPALSSTMKEGRIVTWSKQVGDRVEPGDVLMVVESDKADMDVEAFDSGFVAAHLVREGEAAPVGATVALLAEKEEDIPLIQENGLSLLPSPASAPPSSASSQAVTELLMPSLSASLTTAHVAVWRKKEGDPVNKGEVLFVVESDKADMDVDAPHDGVLAHIAVREGVKVPVGSAVGYLAPSAAAAAAFKNAGLFSSAAAAENPSTMPEGALEIFMPALSSTMTSGKVSKWNKAVGDVVHVGDTLMVVESDKADMDVESFDEGYLAAITVAEGESAPVGQTVAIIVPSKDDIPKVQDALEAAASASSLSTHTAVAAAPSSTTPSPASSAASSSVPVSPPKAASARGGGRTEAFATHDAALAGWTSPSVDQDVKDQLPAGLTGNDLQQEWMQRIQATLPTAFSVLKENPQIQKALTERLNLRVPPPHTLRVAPSPPPYLRRAASAFGPGTSGPADTQGSGVERKARGAARDPSGQPLATFNAVELAKKNKLNLEEVKGTGTNRRITVADVRHHLHLHSDEAAVVTSSRGEKEGKSESSGVPAGSVPLDAMQKAIARNMEATMDVPVFRVSRGIFVDKLEAMMQELKQIVAEQNAAAIAAEGPDAPQQPPVTMSVLLAKAVALTLEKHPIMNAAYNPTDGGHIQHPGAVNVAMAVSIDGGLLTPVLRDANRKSVFELSADWAALVDKARKRRLTAEENSAGTFYISNLGMFGVSQFDAVLPKGVGTIMAVGGTESVPFFPKTGADSSGLSVRRRMTVTLTADHRHIYGSHAAAFLKDFASLLETHPSALLI
ncbi:pyruvate dehydrogenase E2 component, related [Neospora caninum Liverpool]|uniref:Dihydrolipoamide acetyltransferase component of pyruvate dehydrogenase complex n=1 Tax=Neospora caninum (strain Liverpool) TaxID=572307 RepID=F0VAZ1_NEOCL|nr:pyruvate dehydrogenase E2 component, related [Neospora caninum Liverpool]CBZ51367.1 pyruvate dehydrogenase E2 component, related [Neospora caninum Liverpool]CEL68686.1 TPA: Pyruvate dehydrogenase E2 component, related [Neospora caninum Liverpool]|eukprot:XP_003881400.1 pyruvate dehydrogenase E2 component, related [Neospora caninum Liverpool]